MFRYPLGFLGLVLIALTTWGVKRLGRPRRAERLAGRVALFVAAATGWLFDRLMGRHKTPRVSATRAARPGQRIMTPSEGR